MRSKTIFGALLVSVALCSQGFGFELLDRMLGLNGGGCGECNACAKVAPCDPCAKVAACPAPCEKVACGGACGEGRKCRPTPVRDLFGNIKDLFEAKGVQCEPVACEVAKPCNPCGPVGCEKVKKCRKVRCEKACNPCEPACKTACEPACKVACKAACEPVCEKPCEPKCHKLYRRPVLELLEKLFCCENNQCGTGCETGCETGCGGTVVPGKAPAAAPAKAPEHAAPLPQAPKADPSASIQGRGIYQGLVRN